MKKIDKAYGIIYRAINRINGKSYIGQTRITMMHRAKQHFKCARLGSRTVFSRALRKYGIENFEWIQLSEAKNNEELNHLEIHFIKLYNTYRSFKNGYNMTKGGGGRSYQSRKTKNKISRTMKDKIKRGEFVPHISYGKDHHCYRGLTEDRQIRILEERLKGKSLEIIASELSKEYGNRPFSAQTVSRVIRRLELKAGEKLTRINSRYSTPEEKEWIIWKKIFEASNKEIISGFLHKFGRKISTRLIKLLGPKRPTGFTKGKVSPKKIQFTEDQHKFLVSRREANRTVLEIYEDFNTRFPLSKLNSPSILYVYFRNNEKIY